MQVYFTNAFYAFNGSQLAKLKRTFPTCHCHEIYREEAVGLKKLKKKKKA